MLNHLLSNEKFGFVYSTKSGKKQKQKKKKKRKHARQCSVISVSAVLYFTKCGMVWCGAYI